MQKLIVSGREAIDLARTAKEFRLAELAEDHCRANSSELFGPFGKI